MSEFALLLYIYTLSIFYIIAIGLATPGSLTESDITKYGIDKVSGFYGPGSWATWLLTAAACCLSRLLRKTNPHSDKSTPKSTLDLDLVAAFAYPCIAAGDAILRLQHASSDELFSFDLGCIATPLIVVKTGAGIGVLLAMICTRNWGRGSGRGISAAFTSLSALFLIYSNVAFDIIIAGIPRRNILAGVLLLPCSVYPPTASQSTKINKLLFASDLLSPAITSLSDLHFSQPQDVTGMIELYFSCACVGLALVLYGNLRQPEMSLAKPLIFLLPIAFWTFLIVIQFVTFYFLYQYWAVNHLPHTIASVLDLDQLSTLFLGGVLIFLVNGISVTPIAIAVLNGGRKAAKSMLGLFRRRHA